MPSSAKTLPPLSHSVLQNILRVQESATRGLKDCGYGGTVTLNEEKAIEILCACAVEEADLRFSFYAASPDFCQDWVKQVAIKSVESALACFPQYLFVISESYRMIGLDGNHVLRYEEPSRFEATIGRVVVSHLRKRLSARKISAVLPLEKEPQVEALIAHRKALLEEYKAATGGPSSMRIYQASRSGIHKPQFYEWVNGILAAESETTKNFERFLAEKKPPIPRKQNS